MYIDLFILALMVWAVVSGWRNGFVKEIFSTLGIFSGLIVAGAIYYYLADGFLAVKGTQTNMLLSIGAFFILWVIVPIVLGMVANMLTATLKGLQLGYPNSLLGVVFSVVKFTVLLSCVLNMMLRLNILETSKTKDATLFEPLVEILPFIQHDLSEAITAGDNFSAGDTLWVDFSRK